MEPQSVEKVVMGAIKEGAHRLVVVVVGLVPGELFLLQVQEE
jgi:hypothetical protein